MTHNHSGERRGAMQVKHRILTTIQVAFALVVGLATLASIVKLYSIPGHGGHFPLRQQHSPTGPTPSQLFALSVQISEVQSSISKALEQIHISLNMGMTSDLQKLALEIVKERQEHSNLLLNVSSSLDQVRNFILRLKLSDSSMYEPSPKTEDLHAGKMTIEKEEQDMPLEMDVFETEEIKKYIHVRENRLRKKNFMGANATYASIGHACIAMKEELEQYMGYDVGDYCEDDWPLGQRLMVHGCDPLPRRRCLALAPKIYQKPFPVKQSLWTIPDDRNVRWSRYICKNFSCLAAKAPSSKKGFFKCAECFDLAGTEASKWVAPPNISVDFLISEVLMIKPGEIRIGLDFGPSVGTFAARMKEHDVTIVSATLNLGAPFNEMIALRGLVPLYLSVNQRLPFFDNTLDLIHTSLFLDGWIDHIFLDFIIFDWDRVLRPGGLLWIDRFFCAKTDLEDYLYFFLQLHYKKHRWVTAPKLDKSGDEVFFSAVLEKPPRPF